MILALAVGFVDFGYEFCGLWLWLWLWLWQWLWVVVVVVMAGEFSGFLFCSSSLVWLR